jgi:tetratricopeptide (TPR) repeat protein
MSDEAIAGGAGASGGASAREEGTAFLRQGQFTEAAAALRRAVEADPNDESSWRLLGGALASGGDSDGAIDAFQKAVEINPGSAKNHYNVAVALQGAGRIAEARASVAEALVLDPNYQQAQARQQELEILLPGSGSGFAAPQTPPSASSSGASAYDVPPSDSPVLRPVASAGDSRIPPPPPPGGYAPPPPMPPGSYRPPAPGGSYAPPQGGGYPPQGAPGDYAPPPTMGQAYGMAAPDVNGTTILVLGILSIVCLYILGPIAWIMGNNALKTLDQYPYADQSQRGTVIAGRVTGIIGTVFLAISVLSWIIFIIAAIAGDGK